MNVEIRRRLFLVMLTAWLVGTIAVWLTTSNAFGHARTVFDTAERTGLAKKIQPLSDEDAHMVMRHLAAETNRSIFRFWDKFQLVLGVLTLAIGWGISAATWRKVCLAVALVMALLLTLWITPTVLTLGPPLDFVPHTPEPPEHKTFMIYHSLYLILDGVKMIGIAAVIAAIVRERSEPVCQ